MVEDQDDVRSLIREVLEDHGYKVLDASGGAVALGLAGEAQGTIHLLLTDVVMPGMTGTELARVLTPSRPEMKVLYMSGYTENVIVRQGVLKEGISHIQKPLTPAVLAARVREILGPG